MRKIIIAAAAVTAILASPQAYAAGTTNGFKFNGLKFNGLKWNGLVMNGTTDAAATVLLQGITLPGGATLNSLAR